MKYDLQSINRKMPIGKTVHTAVCAPQAPEGLVCTRARANAVTGGRLTASARTEKRMLFSSSARLLSRHLTYETDLGLRLEYNRRESIRLKHSTLS